jgi:hypothetical protein
VKFETGNSARFYRKSRKGERVYLIRLTREYTDGGMDRRAGKTAFISIQRKTSFSLMDI